MSKMVAPSPSIHGYSGLGVERALAISDARMCG